MPCQCPKSACRHLSSLHNKYQSGYDIILILHREQISHAASLFLHIDAAADPGLLIALSLSSMSLSECLLFRENGHHCFRHRLRPGLSSLPPV
jgi:hypothetical protein